MKVFISWSGERSKHVAIALRDWLPSVIQSVKPWMSATDIDAGERWNQSVQNELKEAVFGIICVTTENQIAPWLQFEAGALAKTIIDTYVCPYLIQMEPKDLTSGPLTQFQCKSANKEDTFKLICAINSALKTEQLSEEKIRKAFELWWPELEVALNNTPGVSSPAIKRSPNDMIEEILVATRDIKRILQDTVGLMPEIECRTSGLAGLMSDTKERNGVDNFLSVVSLFNTLAKEEKRNSIKRISGTGD